MHVVLTWPSWVVLAHLADDRMRADERANAAAGVTHEKAEELRAAGVDV